MCTGRLCGVARLPVAFCVACLANRNGEDVASCVAAGDWVCPRCRGGCGPGCSGSACDSSVVGTGCCNCGPCRKRQGLEPTGQAMPAADRAGYTNVHDYLVGTKLGLDQAGMHARRLAKGWGHWSNTLAVREAAAAAAAAGGAGPSSAPPAPASPAASREAGAQPSDDEEAGHMPSQSPPGAAKGTPLGKRKAVDAPEGRAGRAARARREL